MIKLIELFNEIKVNNPNDIFHVTELGKQVNDGVYQLHMALNKINDDKLRDSIMDLDNFNLQNWFYIINSKYGENIIETDKPNKLQDYLQNYDNKMGDEDGKEALIYFENFKKKGWIK